MNPSSDSSPRVIKVRGAHVHNLQHIDVDIPLRQLVGIAGVSGSGKSSLALGVLYAEGSRRYIEALSTYTRRRLAQSPRAAVQSVTHVPAALALRQRPGVPSVRSTFGTSTELLNVIRLMFSRLGSHVCPNGHRLSPTINVAAGKSLTCPECQVTFDPPEAESFAFNGTGACPTCHGTAIARQIDEDRLIPDPGKTVGGGAVAPWSMFGLAVMPQVAEALGVPLDVPYRDLSNHDKHIILHGAPEKRRISVPSKSGKLFTMNFTYRSAYKAVEEAMKNATSENGLTRINRFITTMVCPACRGTRLSPEVLNSEINHQSIATVSQKTLAECIAWAPTVVHDLPHDMQSMAKQLIEQLQTMAQRLVELGLDYLTLDRASSTLSTGERQRTQLARAVRNRTTGILYVLDEPSIGLHPANIDGLLGVMRDLLTDGNSVVLVDHDTQVLAETDWLIEIGLGSGSDGGTVVTEGMPSAITADSRSLIGEFLHGNHQRTRQLIEKERLFENGEIYLKTGMIHTVHPLDVRLPKGRLITVTGVSGSGKTTLVLDSLVPALKSTISRQPLPSHIQSIETADITNVNVVDATPIGANVRSTVATYSGVLDDLRRAFADTYTAKQQGLSTADFSYNTGSLRCPNCDGNGQIVLDVQFLPDVTIECPICRGSRYAPAAETIHLKTASDQTISLPKLLSLTVRQAIDKLSHVPRIAQKLETLADLGLGYLTLGEATPTLSGGEAQRLKLASKLHVNQAGSLFVFDEPSIGLHPLDIRTLLSVLQRLIDQKATVIVIEHDTDIIANADYVIDMGPGGGVNGGQIVAAMTPVELAKNPDSITGRYLTSTKDT